MNKIGISCVIIGITLIAIGVIWTIVEMVIDHNCYQLTPNEFYKSSICERYWNNE